MFALFVSSFCDILLFGFKLFGKGVLFIYVFIFETARISFLFFYMQICRFCFLFHLQITDIDNNITSPLN